MSNKDKKKNRNPEKTNQKDEQVLKNQLDERYQDSVINDKLNNNKGVYTFNNQSK